MRVKDKVRIAFWNLGAGKQMMKKMIFGMVFVFMIIFCFLMVMQSYFAYIEEFNQKHVTDCYYYSEIGRQELAENVIEGLITGSHEMQEKYHAVETSVLCTLDLTEGEELLAAGNMGLILNGETCQAVNYYVSRRKMYQSIQGNSSPVSVGLYQPGMDVFADKITKEYKKGYLMGSYPECPGEIMLDTHILEVFGVENIEESLLGTVMFLATVLGIYFSAIFLLLLNMVTKQILDFQIVFDLRTGIVAIVASWLYFWGCMRMTMRKE